MLAGEIAVVLRGQTEAFQKAFGGAINQTKAFNDSMREVQRVEKVTTEKSKSSWVEAAAIWAAAGFAAAKLTGMVKSAFKEIAEEEKSVAQLSSALDQLGYSSKELTPIFNAQAAALEGQGLATDSAVRELQQLLIQFGVAPSDVGATTKAMLDYSAATGKDAHQATLMLLRAVENGGQGMESLGIDVEGTGDKTVDLSNAVKALSERFGGSAAAAASGFAGQLKQLEIAQGNLTEAMGAFLVKTGIASLVVSQLTQAFSFWTDLVTGDGQAAMEEQAERTKEIIRETEDLMRMRNRLAARTRELADAEQTKNDKFIQMAKDRVIAIKFEIEMQENAIRLLKERNTEAGKAAAGITSQGRSKSVIAAAANAEITDFFKSLSDVISSHHQAAKAMVEQSFRSGDPSQDFASVYGGQVADGTITGSQTGHIGDLAKQADLFKTQVKGAFKSAGASVLSALVGGSSSLSAVVQGAMAGFQAGGPIGAIIGAFAGLLTQAQSFMDAINIVSGILGAMANAFNGLMDGFKPLLGAVGSLAEGFMSQFTPILDAFGEMVASIAPIVQIISDVLSPIFKIFGDAMGLIGKAFSWLLTGVMKGLFEVLKYVGIAIIWFVRGLADIWNKIIQFIDWIFNRIADIGIVVGGYLIKPFAGLAMVMQSAFINTSAMTEAMVGLQNATWDSTMAKAEEAAAGYAAADAMKQLGESILNGPAGFRIKAAQAGAMNEEALPHFATGGIVRKKTVAVIGEAGPEAVVPLGKMGSTYNIHLHGISDPRAFWRQLKEIMRSEGFADGGAMA